jgi:type I restriction enzyme S subunit
MNKGWEIKKLGEVAIVSSGNSAPQKKELFENGIYPFIRTSDVGQIRKGFISSCVDYLNINGIKGLKLYKKGTILFPKSGASTFLNHRVIMEIDSYVSSHLATIKGNNSIIDDLFLLYFLTTIDARDLMQDIAYPSLKTSDISLIPIPIPPLSEQQGIVSILDESFAAINKAKANAEQNLLNSSELFENSAQLIFTQKNNNWEERLLGEFGTFRNGINYTKGSKGEKIKIVGVKDFQDDYWVPENGLAEVSLDGKINETDLLKEGDILAVRSNGNPQLIGRTLLAGKINEKVSHSGFTIRIRLNSKIVNPKYLCHFLKINQTRKELIESGNGVGIRSLNQGALSSLKIPFPKSLKDQEMIIDKVESILEQTQKLKDIYQKKIADLEELKKSLLEKAFRGEL